MKKQIIAVFAGQGSQFPGMGKELYTESEAARHVFTEAVEVMGDKITTLCFDTDLDELTRTINAQPAIYTVSYAAYAAFLEALEKENRSDEVEIVACGGHSLGEYTALPAAEAVDFKSGLTLVNHRAGYMQQAGEENEGTMAAIMGLSFEKLAEICLEVEKELNTIVSVGLFNTPDQLVASGTIAGIDRVIEKAKEAGAKRAMPLTVGGPFHTAIMTPAAEKLKQQLPELTMKNPKYPVALNGYGEITNQASRIKEGIIRQINNPILWVKCVQALREQYPQAAFIEFCPKNVLKGLTKKIDRSIEMYTCDTPESISATIEKLLTESEAQKGL